MENNDRIPETGGTAEPDKPQKLVYVDKDGSGIDADGFYVPPPGKEPPIPEPGKRNAVWDPPAYLKVIGRALEACGLPDSVQTAAEAAQELRTLYLTTADSCTDEILKGQVHLLNGVFAKLVETGIAKPVENLPLILAALKTQELCNITVTNIRMEGELTARLEHNNSQHFLAEEKNRIARIRLGINHSDR
jgi:hypothetical protein